MQKMKWTYEIEEGEGEKVNVWVEEWKWRRQIINIPGGQDWPYQCATIYQESQNQGEQLKN